jgi:hypothetical protein
MYHSRSAPQASARAAAAGRCTESDARRWRRGRRGARCGFSAFERSFGYANNNNLVQPGYAMAAAPPRATASPAHETRTARRRGARPGLVVELEWLV